MKDTMNASEAQKQSASGMDDIAAAPRGLALLWMIGPAFVWAGEFIGSGEVILATRLGGVLGTSILWAPALAVILKCWIGMGGARYTVCTGEGMIDMFSRLPGPKNWAVWIILIAQTLGAAVSIGVLAKAAGLFAASLVPLPPFLCSWILTLAAVFLVWSGRFEYLKRSMTILVTVVIIGVGYVAVRTIPSLNEILRGLFLFNVPPIPEWAAGKAGPSAWNEIIPLMGWAAGGFASQVWYTYWVLGAGYGMAHGRNYGEPADEARLKRMTGDGARRILGWCRMVYTDASTALLIGITLTMAFMLAGAGILHPRHLVPESSQVATTLATIFGSQWGRLGEKLFLIAGATALFKTQIGQLAGWPRLLSDSCRICLPGFGRIPWKRQFRGFLLGFLTLNFIIAYAVRYEPVRLIQLAAYLDGVMLVPLQAAAIIAGLYYIQPSLLSQEAARILRPHWVFAVMLLAGTLAYLFFAVIRWTL